MKTKHGNDFEAESNKETIKHEITQEIRETEDLQDPLSTEVIEQDLHIDDEEIRDVVPHVVTSLDEPVTYAEFFV